MAKEKESVGCQLIDLVGKAKPDDLAAIDESIAAKVKELDSLRAVRKVLAMALGVETDKRRSPKKAASPPPPKVLAGGVVGGPEERRKAIAVHLMKHGDATISELAAAFKVSYQTIPNTLNEHPWFEKDDNVYGLTPQGREAAKQLALKAS